MLAASAGKRAATPCTAEGARVLMVRLHSAVGRLEASAEKSAVQRQTAELNLLAEVENAREFLVGTAKGGGEVDIRNVALIWAVCDHTAFSTTNAGDPRLQACVTACEAIQSVMEDKSKGLRARLGKARQAAAEALVEGDDDPGTSDFIVPLAEASLAESEAIALDTKGDVQGALCSYEKARASVSTAVIAANKFRQAKERAQQRRPLARSGSNAAEIGEDVAQLEAHLEDVALRIGYLRDCGGQACVPVELHIRPVDLWMNRRRSTRVQVMAACSALSAFGGLVLLGPLRAPLAGALAAAGSAQEGDVREAGCQEGRASREEEEQRRADGSVRKRAEAPQPPQEEGEARKQTEAFQEEDKLREKTEASQEEEEEEARKKTEARFEKEALGATSRNQNQKAGGQEEQAPSSVQPGRAGQVGTAPQGLTSHPMSLYKQFSEVGGKPCFWEINARYEGLHLVSLEPLIFVLPNLLTKGTCEAIIAKAAPHMERSTVAEQHGTMRTSRTSSSRTSSDTRFHCDECGGIQQIFARALNTNTDRLELPKVIRYEEGQRFGKHIDAYPTPNCDNGMLYGNRVATLFVYLNDVEEGGDTVFLEAIGDGKPLRVHPQRGLAVIHFPAHLPGHPDRSKRGRPDWRTAHCADTAVSEKWILTQHANCANIRRRAVYEQQRLTGVHV